MTDDGRAVLSCSSGSADSHLYVYDITSGEPDLFFETDGASVPVTVLGDGRLVKDVRIPRMSEDIEYVDGGVLIGFESAAKKYGGPYAPLCVGSAYRFEL